MNPSSFFHTSLFVLATSALAANMAHADAGSSLGDCYDHVITACNTTAHPVPCSTAGMDACDEEHSASDAAVAIQGIRVVPGTNMRGEPRYQVLLQTDRPQTRRPGIGEDGDSDGRQPLR